MNYSIESDALPHSMKAHGIQAWVGDQPLDMTLLERKHLRLMSVFMYRDMRVEIVIYFTMPTREAASTELLAACRHCALDWFSEWMKSGTCHLDIPRAPVSSEDDETHGVHRAIWVNGNRHSPKMAMA